MAMATATAKAVAAVARAWGTARPPRARTARPPRAPPARPPRAPTAEACLQYPCGMGPSHVFSRAVVPDPPRVDHAKGAEIWDTEGRRWLDGAGGAVVVNLGHGDERVVEAMRAQASRVAYAHGTMFTSDALEAYADELATVVPVDGARVYPVSGGSEAIETALKMARAYHLARGQDRLRPHRPLVRLRPLGRAARHPGRGQGRLLRLLAARPCRCQRPGPRGRRVRGLHPRPDLLPPRGRGRHRPGGAAHPARRRPGRGLRAQG